VVWLLRSLLEKKLAGTQVVFLVGRSSFSLSLVHVDGAKNKRIFRYGESNPGLAGLIL